MEGIPADDLNLYRRLLDRVEQLDQRVAELENSNISLTSTVYALERQVIQTRCNMFTIMVLDHINGAYDSVQIPAPPILAGGPDLFGYHAANARKQQYQTLANHVGSTFQSLCGTLSNSETPLEEARNWYRSLYDYLDKNGLPHILASVGREGFSLMVTEE